MVSSIRLSPQCGRLCPKQTRPRESTANFGSRTGCPGLLGAHTTPVQLRGAAKLPWQDDALRTRTVRFWPPEAIKGSYMTARSARYGVKAPGMGVLCLDRHIRLISAKKIGNYRQNGAQTSPNMQISASMCPEIAPITQQSRGRI